VAVGLTVTAGVAVYAGVATWLGVSEVRSIWTKVRRQFARMR
jgi:hypothetical protein